MGRERDGGIVGFKDGRRDQLRNWRDEVDGWWSNGRMGGGIVGWVEGGMVGSTEEGILGGMGGWMEGLMEEWLKGLLDG